MAWETTGNRSTNPATDFLGTLDAQPLVFKTYGTERLRFKELGGMEINGDVPITVKSSATMHFEFRNSAGARIGGLKSGPMSGLRLDGGGPSLSINPSGQVVVGDPDPSAGAVVSTLHVGAKSDDGITVSAAASNLNRGLFFSSGPQPRVGSLFLAGNNKWSADAVSGDVVLSTSDNTKLLLHNGDGKAALSIVGNKVGIGMTTPKTPLSFPNTPGDKISLYGDSGGRYGFGIQSNLLQIYADVPGSDIAFGWGSSSNFHQVMRLRGNNELHLGADAGKGGYTALAMSLSAPMGGYALLQSIKSSGSAWGDLVLNQRGGNVGIGTSTPQHSLAIIYNGGPRWTSALWGGALEISNASAIAWSANAAGQRRGIGQTNGGLFFFRTASDPGNTTSPATTDMIITDAGNVGVGTQTPQAKLDVSGNVRVAGDITVTGDVVLKNADCAEEFAFSGSIECEPGTVVVIGDGGDLRASEEPYDKRVAGVVSGAGEYQPAIILHRQESQDRRAPVALMGTVACKVDAQYSPIEVGDLLTTSPTAGHAMKASDPHRAFGAVIGKALSPLAAGDGLIPILIALQ